MNTSADDYAILIVNDKVTLTADLKSLYNHGYWGYVMNGISNKSMESEFTMENSELNIKIGTKNEFVDQCSFNGGYKIRVYYG